MANNKQIHNVAIVGTGGIGASWAALYFARGLQCHRNAPRPPMPKKTGAVTSTPHGSTSPPSACVLLKSGMILVANDLTSNGRQYMANYKIPRRVEFSDIELPKSGSGKILKRLLRERFWAHEERAVS
jgi:acyl-CoA synthetase (AMP-forming)/AMP-acid ligase II